MAVPHARELVEPQPPAVGERHEHRLDIGDRAEAPVGLRHHVERV
jgi:hypothetical protein